MNNAPVVFKWINKQEIYSKRTNQAKDNRLQAHIDRCHIDYIATKAEAVKNKYSEHALFGTIYDKKGIPLDVEKMSLSDIRKRVGEITKNDGDVFKTIISLEGDDALEQQYNTREKFKELVEHKIEEIRKSVKPEIPIENFEFVASFHAKEGHPHVHIDFWNNKDYENTTKKPFINYKNIRKEFAKEIFSNKLQELYNIKNVSKKEISILAKDELERYKRNLTESLNIKNLELNVVDTSKEENFIKDLTQNLKIGQKIYLYDKENPNNFTEIKKVRKWYETRKFNNIKKWYKDKLEFKNNGKKGILYKENTLSDTASFLKDFKEIGIAKNSYELEKIIKTKTEEDLKISNLLKEVMPEEIPERILDYKFKEENFEIISSKLQNLINITNNFEKGFKYQYQTPEVKQAIDDISKLILNTSMECKEMFYEYINSEIEASKYLADIENSTDYERVKQRAKDTMYSKIGNQILQFIKNTKSEVKEENWKKRQEEYENKKAEYEINRKQSQIDYEKRNETKNLIKSVFSTLDEENTVNRARNERLKESFKNMSKEAKREWIKKMRNSSGFDWGFDR